jgi:membrane protease YdiL (CAAX protease family)
MIFQAAMRGRNDWFLYLVGFFLVSLGYIIGQSPLVLVMMYYTEIAGDPSLLMEVVESMDFSLINMPNNLGFLLALQMFVFAAIALWLVVKYLLKRPFITLINNLSGIRWSRFLVGFGIWFSFSLILEVANYLIHPDDYTFSFQLANFLPLLIIALVFITIQASFEEWFIRGYCLQGIGILSNSRVLALILTSILFASLHMMNPEVAKFGVEVMATYYFVVALFLGVVVLMDDGLELAMGIHVATNIFGSVFVSFEGSALQTDALFRVGSPNPWLILIATIVFSALFLYIGTNLYGWQGWKERLLGFVRFPGEAEEPQLLDE